MRRTREQLPANSKQSSNHSCSSPLGIESNLASMIEKRSLQQNAQHVQAEAKMHEHTKQRSRTNDTQKENEETTSRAIMKVAMRSQAQKKMQMQGTSKPESRRCFATRLSMHSQLPACSEKSSLQKALTHEDQDAHVKKRIKNQMITQHPLLVSGGARRFVEKVCCILRKKQASRQMRTQGSVSKQARSKIAAQI